MKENYENNKEQINAKTMEKYYRKKRRTKKPKRTKYTISIISINEFRCNK